MFVSELRALDPDELIKIIRALARERKLLRDEVARLRRAVRGGISGEHAAGAGVPAPARGVSHGQAHTRNA